MIFRSPASRFVGLSASGSAPPTQCSHGSPCRSIRVPYGAEPRPRKTIVFEKMAPPTARLTVWSTIDWPHGASRLNGRARRNNLPIETMIVGLAIKYGYFGTLHREDEDG